MKRLDKISSDPNIPVPDLESENHVNHGAGGDTAQAVAKKRKRESENDVCLTGSRVYALPNGTSPCNPHIVEIIDLVKPKVVDLVEHANMVSMTTE